jgi:hypothetical protein
VSVSPAIAFPTVFGKTAVAAARRHGVSRTAGLLHLEAGKLKQLMTGARSCPQPGAAPLPAFVELLAPSATGSGECTVEIEGPRGGRVRVQLRSAPLPDLVALARVVWHAGM